MELQNFQVSVKKKIMRKSCKLQIVSMVEGSPRTAWILFSLRQEG